MSRAFGVGLIILSPFMALVVQILWDQMAIGGFLVFFAPGLLLILNTIPGLSKHSGDKAQSLNRELHCRNCNYQWEEEDT